MLWVLTNCSSTCKRCESICCWVKAISSVYSWRISSKFSVSHRNHSSDKFEILCLSLNRPELDRPAKDLYSYELSSILDAALRSTNSQYDDPEILNHLDVRLMNNFEGDTGWDIFSLQYTVRGPLSTMLEPSMAKYLQLFKHLWRMKHLEFVLSSKIWKDQVCNAKVKPLLSITQSLQWITSLSLPSSDIAPHEERTESSHVPSALVHIGNDSFHQSNSVLHSVRSGRVFVDKIVGQSAEGDRFG